MPLPVLQSLGKSAMVNHREFLRCSRKACVEHAVATESRRVIGRFNDNDAVELEPASAVWVKDQDLLL
jgi:hypothetical protein